MIKCDFVRVLRHETALQSFTFSFPRLLLPPEFSPTTRLPSFLATNLFIIYRVGFTMTTYAPLEHRFIGV